MKRIISILLLLSLLFGMVTVYAENKTEECEETSFLKTIGVLENNFKESMEITKGEFTKRVVSLLYPDVLVQKVLFGMLTQKQKTEYT